MSLLGNIRNQEYVPDKARVLIHGQPGTGKTTLAGSIASVGPTLFVYVPGEEGIGSLNGHKFEDNLVRHRLESIPQLHELYEDFYKGEHDFDAVVIDSVSALQTLWKKYLLGQPMDSPAKDRPSTDYAFWGALADGFNDFFTFWYALASSKANRPVHVVMTSQTKALDDAEGESKMQPDLHKGPLAPALSRSDQILYTHMQDHPDDWDKQQHAVRLKPGSGVTAKTRCSREIAEKLPDVATNMTLPGYLKNVGVAGL